MIAAYLITIREGIEAALIVAIVLAYIKKASDDRRLKRVTLLGAFAAILLSIIAGVGVYIIYGGLEGIAEVLFEGFASLFAAIVLTYMIFWMNKKSKSFKKEIEQKIRYTLNHEEYIGLFLVSFTAVLREGVETVLFTMSLLFTDFTGTLLGISLGLVTVLIIGGVILTGSKEIPLKAFFKYSGIALIVLAAGMLGYGVHELIEAAEIMGIELGILGVPAFDINPPVNPDGSYPWFHEKGIVGTILKSLVGYDGNPEILRVIVYIGYWLVVGMFYIKSHFYTQDKEA